MSAQSASAFEIKSTRVVAEEAYGLIRAIITPCYLTVPHRHSALADEVGPGPIMCAPTYTLDLDCVQQSRLNAHI